MNMYKATLSLVIAALIAGFIYQRNEVQKLNASLASVGKERESVSRQISQLNRRISEPKAREAAPPPAAEAPRPVPAAPVPVAQLLEELPVPGITRTAPAGWMKNGSKPDAYVVGVDRLQNYGGMPSAYVKSVQPSVQGFGGMMQMSAADDHLGQRVRLSGWAKTEDANDGGGHLWFRVDGQQRGATLQFDNMDNRPIKGTTDWQHYSVVLDVPPEAAALAYGFFVNGTGKMWVSGAKIETVGPEVPSTNMIKNQARSLPKTPVNLSFDPDHP
jgi:hypothetical protein